MSFITDAQLTTELQNVLKQPSGLTATNWGPIVTRKNNAAYWSIVEGLLCRGYLKSQIDLFDRGAEFQKDIALWMIIFDSGSVDPETYNSQLLSKTDRREELKYVVVLTNGVFVQPLGTLGQVASGPMSTGTDMIVWPDPADPSLGQVAQF